MPSFAPDMPFLCPPALTPQGQGAERCSQRDRGPDANRLNGVLIDRGQNSREKSLWIPYELKEDKVQAHDPRKEPNDPAAVTLGAVAASFGLVFPERIISKQSK